MARSAVVKNMAHSGRTKPLRFDVLPRTQPYHKREACAHTLNKPLQNGNYICTSRASYLVNGIPMCERHAGRELIMYHLREIGIFKLPGDKLT